MKSFRSTLIKLVAFAATLIQVQAAVVRLQAGGDLQAAINAAQRGDTIMLDAGASFVGNFFLPAKPSGSGVITIESSAMASLPAGVRVDPTQAKLMARLITPNTGSVLRFGPGASDYTIRGVEVTVVPSVYSFGLVTVGEIDEPDPNRLPNNIVFDRAYVHGDPVSGLKRGIMLNSKSATITNSHISDVKGIGQDTQAILSCNSIGPHLIHNNRLEAAGENVMLGGCNTSRPYAAPSDVTITKNYFYKPLSWQTQGWSVKNLFEIKTGRRVRVEGNRFENNWVHSQNGFAILFTVRADGVDDSGQPWGIIEDVTFSNNTVLNSPHGVTFLGNDYLKGNAGSVTRVTIANNYFDRVGRLVQVIGNAKELTVDHNTSPYVNGMFVLTDGGPIERFTLTNNLLAHGEYGWVSSGLSSLDAIRLMTPGATVTGNVLIGGNAARYPVGLFTFAPTFDSIKFRSPQTGDYSLQPSSPYRRLAADRTDPGANFELLNQMQQGVVDGYLGTAPKGRKRILTESNIDNIEP